MRSLIVAVVVICVHVAQASIYTHVRAQKARVPTCTYVRTRRKFYKSVTEVFRHHIAQSIVRGNSNIWPIALVLKQLWRTNSRTSWLHPASYYVPEIRSMFDLKADFDRWNAWDV